MGKKNIKELYLEGLSCANCASKIEAKIQSISEVSSATVDFVSKKLIIEFNHESEINNTIKEATEIIKRIEPHVKVINMEDLSRKEVKDHHEDGNNRQEVVKIGVGGILFVLALVLKLPNWLELSVFLTAYIIVGGEIILRALKNITKGQVFDENFLMSIATIGAFAIGEFPEGVAVMLFYQIGELFQDIAVTRSRKSISDLMDIRPDYANLKVSNGTKKVSPEEVNIGDVIIIKPGEKIPLDGKVMDGSSMLDTSALTGESVPREVEAGAEILSGCINKNGVLTVEVTKEFGESTVTKILELVQNASSKKAPTENFITKFARYYTPVVVIAAFLLAILPPLVIPEATFSQWIYRACIFLVISCPCALVVSIPLGFFGGIGGASKRGILVKGSNYLEGLNDVDIVVFDKTGTLTKGVFKVTEIDSTDDISDEELLEYAAYAESYSNHPIALSILQAFGKEVDKEKIESYDEISGHGVVVKYKGREIIAGNIKLMEKENISFNPNDTIGTVIYIAVDKKYYGSIVISDEIKYDSVEAIKALKHIGIRKTIMLTGDNKLVGDKIGNQLGVDEVYTELLPNQKVDKVEILDKQKSPNKKLIFVGDGINDAPVLARADIGVAMGGLGSDAAIEAADIVLMTDEPMKLVTAIKVARRTRSIVFQNIIFALGVKFIVLLLGAIGIATMWAAVFADVGVSVIAVINSMRALKVNRL